MSESDMAKALLKVDALDLAGVPDSRQLTWKILDHDRRLVRRMTVLTLVIWLMAAGMVGFVMIAFGLLMPMQAKIAQESEKRQITAEQRAAHDLIHKQTFQMLTVAIAFSVGILALAALSTVRLIFASRRATLRQVNASLVEISRQLKELRQTPVPAPPPQQ
jgi:uncharacterized membrane protein YbhN (UPF0104 family)